MTQFKNPKADRGPHREGIFGLDAFHPGYLMGVCAVDGQPWPCRESQWPSAESQQETGVAAWEGRAMAEAMAEAYDAGAARLRVLVTEYLSSEDEIAHGEAIRSGSSSDPRSRDGIGRCAYCDEPWPCRTQRAIDRLLASLNVSTTGHPGVGNGTITDCTQDGVHDHPFRGPHRFTEWYLGDGDKP